MKEVLYRKARILTCLTPTFLTKLISSILWSSVRRILWRMIFFRSVTFTTACRINKMTHIVGMMSIFRPHKVHLASDTRSTKQSSVVQRDVPEKGYLALIPVLLALLTPYYIPCDYRGPPEKINGEMLPRPVDLADLERHAYLLSGETYYLMPDRPDAVPGLPHVDLLSESQRRLGLAAVDADLDLGALIKEMASLWGGPTLNSSVFSGGAYAPDYSEMRRKLYDSLYLLYVFRRLVLDVSFEGIIQALQTLHALEAMAIHEFLRGLEGAAPSASDQSCLSLLVSAFPALARWNTASGAAPGFPRIRTASDLATFLRADPVVHPIFAKLFYYRHPFNNVRPLGIGDLKVVKQWLVGYAPGEISDIHNIMKGELRPAHTDAWKKLIRPSLRQAIKSRNRVKILNRQIVMR